MTPFPYSIEAAESVATAAEVMAEHDIRHLPVTRQGDLIGLLSDADVRVARGLEAEVRTDVSVGSVCAMDPYVVDISARLDEVVDQMSDRHLHACIVTRKTKLAGILTTTDVCRLLREHLRASVPPPPPSDIA